LVGVAEALLVVLPVIAELPPVVVPGVDLVTALAGFASISEATDATAKPLKTSLLIMNYKPSKDGD
jgi:hypothetical protein